ncbi:RNA polymerase sigma factor [Serinicoccus marinus]|uniref:RNA polymerase sigma factor n=1 Tax=Serinicoccus marinus TaxID=247333 RepID=UPI0009FDECCA|nr:RNA polymerase sigma factor [Serinicoccus marinus]
MDEASAAVAAAVQAGDDLTARSLLRDTPTAGLEHHLQALAGLAADGSRLATELLLEQLDTSGMVRRFVRSSLLDAAAVDDVCQDTLISVASSIGSFRGSARVSTWVHSIVRRRVVDHLRRQRATAPLPPEQEAPAQRMSSMLATRTTVREALGSLPDLYREPVTLRDVEGLTYAEIAGRLDRNLGTVKAQIARGRALVAGALDPSEWTSR